MIFPSTPKLSSQLVSRKNEKGHVKLDFPFSKFTIQLLRFSDHQLRARILFGFRRELQKYFEIDTYQHPLHRFKCNPLSHILAPLYENRGILTKSWQWVSGSWAEHVKRSGAGRKSGNGAASGLDRALKVRSDVDPTVALSLYRRS